MKPTRVLPRARSRRRLLALSIASLLGPCAPAVFAQTTWPVDNCNDDGPGSLRAVIGAQTTVSGDTVDLTARTDCVDSKISLQVGEITIPQDSLTILGPGSDKLTLDATNLPTGNTYQNDSRVLTHKGGGTLEIHGLTLYGGHIYHTGNGYKSRGGCLYSAGSVTLESVDVRNCSVTSLQDEASGGGIYAKGDATLTNVVVYSNSAFGSGNTRGGGVAAFGTVTASAQGAIKDNVAASPNAVFGAGIFGYAGVSLDDAAVILNTATSSAMFAIGGGVYTRYALSASHSVLGSNTVKVSDVGTAGVGGGGAFSREGPVTLDYSSIEDNAAAGTPAYSAGGGLMTNGDFAMTRSTISGNTTTGVGGAIVKGQTCADCGPKFYMRDSTVSQNHAERYIGGVYIASAPQTKLLNSTIAFNTAVVGLTGTPGNYVTKSPGLHLKATVATSATLHSMLVSNNTYGPGTEVDFTDSDNMLITFNADSAHSLIRVTPIQNLPGGVTTGSCPLLGPLSYNGGLTKTHALMSGSPAIDAGDNIPINLAVLDLYDQRGNAAANGVKTYLRVSGPSGDPSPKPDIGAYEVQQDDSVFNSSFEGCPAIN
jgi:hypothetical protein